MASKEYMQSELKNLEGMLEDSKKIEIVELINRCEEDIQRIKNVLKDLERLEKQDKVLEIIKKKAYIYVDEIDIEITDKDEYFDLLKEMLNNE